MVARDEGIHDHEDERGRAMAKRQPPKSPEPANPAAKKATAKPAPKSPAKPRATMAPKEQKDLWTELAERLNELDELASQHNLPDDAFEEELQEAFDHATLSVEEGRFFDKFQFLHLFGTLSLDEIEALIEEKAKAAQQRDNKKRPG
jgi:hypothetical protein